MQFRTARLQRSILALLSFTLGVSLPTSSKAVFTFTNKTLVGFAYKTTENVDWLHCIEDCQQDASCFSYNFWPGTFGGKCELNNCGFEDECSAQTMLIWGPGWIFQQLKNTQVREEYTEIYKMNEIFSNYFMNIAIDSWQENECLLNYLWGKYIPLSYTNSG